MICLLFAAYILQVFLPLSVVNAMLYQVKNPIISDDDLKASDAIHEHLARVGTQIDDPKEQETVSLLSACRWILLASHLFALISFGSKCKFISASICTGRNIIKHYVFSNLIELVNIHSY